MWTVYDEHGHNIGETTRSKIGAMNVAKSMLYKDSMFVTLYHQDSGHYFRVTLNPDARHGINVQTLDQPRLV